MAALTADRNTLTRNVQGEMYDDYVLGSGSVVYAGGLAALNTGTGRAVAATAAASRVILGMFKEAGTGTTAGTVRAKVVWNIEAQFAAATSNITSADIGTVATVSDDQTVGGTAVGTAGVRVNVGLITAADSGGIWVHLRNSTTVTAAAG